MIENSRVRAASRTLVLALAGMLLAAPVAAASTAPQPPAPGAEPRVVVESARLLEATSLGTWFGGAARPVLEIVLYNNGQSAFTPVLEIEWKDGNGLPNGVDEPLLEELAPGTRATVEVPVQFENLAQGQHTVYGVVRAGGREDVMQATVTLVPWGLYGLVVVALLAGSALRTRWTMTQLDREDAVEEPVAPRAEVPAPRVPAQVRAPEPQQAPEPQPALVGPPPLPSTRARLAARGAAPAAAAAEADVVPVADVEARALATMERFAVTREQRAVPQQDAEAPSVPQQRAPRGGRRAARSHKASTPWLSRR